MNRSGPRWTAVAIPCASGLFKIEESLPIENPASAWQLGTLLPHELMWMASLPASGEARGAEGRQGQRPDQSARRPKGLPQAGLGAHGAIAAGAFERHLHMLAQVEVSPKAEQMLVRERTWPDLRL